MVAIERRCAETWERTHPSRPALTINDKASTIVRPVCGTRIEDAGPLSQSDEEMLMEEQGLCAPAQTAENRANGSAARIWVDLSSLAILILLAVGLRAWQIAHTEVTSRDSIGYIRIAWHLQHESWNEVIPHAPQHPAYPLAVLAMSVPVRHYIPDDLPLAWQLSAQLASALAGVLLILPMFLLGRELFDRRVAFWASLLIQCLPSSGKVMGDGLSDSLFLLFACSALWLACVALRRGSRLCFALTGLAGGLAYLTRPEGALVVGVTGLVLLGLQVSRRWRRSWRSVLVNGTSLSAAAVAVMVPYMVLIGGITVKNTPNIMINQQRPDADWEGRLRPQASSQPGTSRSSGAPGTPLFAIWWKPELSAVEEVVANTKDLSELQHLKPPSRYLWALKALYVELNKGFFYAAWLPAMLGLWWSRDNFCRVPGAWVLLLTCLFLTGLLYRVAEKMGYLSDRHLLLVILCGSYWAVAGVVVLGERLAISMARLRPDLTGTCYLDRRGWSLGLLMLLTLSPLPRTLERLHAERAGFRTIGQWLAEHTRPGDFIEDPYCWASYYAGRVFLEGREDLAAERPPCYYVVLEKSQNPHPHLVSLAMAMIHTGEKRSVAIHNQKVRRGKQTAEITVYKVPGPYHSIPLPGLPGQGE
jgi:hypothetical protein